MLQVHLLSLYPTLSILVYFSCACCRFLSGRQVARQEMTHSEAFRVVQRPVSVSCSCLCLPVYTFLLRLREKNRERHTKTRIQRDRQTFRPLIKLRRHSVLSQRTVSMLRRCSFIAHVGDLIKFSVVFVCQTSTDKITVDIQYSKSSNKWYKMNLERHLRHCWDDLRVSGVLFIGETYETGFAHHCCLTLLENPAVGSCFGTWLLVLSWSLTGRPS